MNTNTLNTYSKSNNYFFYILATLALLPSVTFGLLQAEVFPWALIFTLVYCRSINSKLLYLIIFFIFSSLWGIYASAGEALGESVRSFFAYLNALIIFNVILNSNEKRILDWIKVCKVLFVVLSIWGLLQFTGILKPLDDLFKLLIPRGYTYPLSFAGDRGVTLLSTEPARAGVEYIFIYLLVRNFISIRKVILDLSVGLFIIFFIKSAMALFMYLIAMFFIYRSISLLLLIAISPFLSLLINNLSSFNSRSITLAYDLLSQESFSESVNILLNTSGQRVLSIYSFYIYGVANPLGGGIGNWVSSSMESLELTNLKPSELRYFIFHNDGHSMGYRGSGFITNLMLDCGIITVIYFFSYLRSTIKRNIKSMNNPLVITFIINILFIGSVGTPVAWIILAVYLRYTYFNREKLTAMDS